MTMRPTLNPNLFQAKLQYTLQALDTFFTLFSKSAVWTCAALQKGISAM